MEATRKEQQLKLLSAALIICVILHALSTRYSHIPQGAILDRWTGKLYPLKLENK